MADGAVTLKELLWGPDVRNGLASCLRRALGNVSALSGIAAAPIQAIMSEATEALGEALDVGLGDILAGAWNDSQKLRDAADPDVHGPEEIIFVPLVEHEIRSEHKPTLEFTLDGRTVCGLEFVVELALQLEGVVLRIKAGRIRSAVAGSCHASASLSCGGARLIGRETRDISLPLSVDLGEGILIPTRKHASPSRLTAAKSS